MTRWVSEFPQGCYTGASSTTMFLYTSYTEEEVGKVIHYKNTDYVVTESVLVDEIPYDEETSQPVYNIYGVREKYAD